MKFEINQWVAYQVTVEKKIDGRDRRVVEAPVSIQSTERVAYLGRVKKITIDADGERYWVAFAPDQQWQEFGPKDLEDAAIQINPPRSVAASGRPTDYLPSDFDNPTPKTER